MPRVLIVDDSPIERRLVERLLARRSDWMVETASNGLEALHIIRADAPDLVLTDIRMPQIDGLQLLERIRAKYASIPVVIMTAFGSEELAMRALKAGAASYVPKRLLVSELIDIVAKLLSIVETRVKDHCVTTSLVSSETTYSLPNEISFTSAVVSHLLDAGLDLDAFDAVDRTRLAVALEEALANAVIHGNLEVSSKLRQEGTGEFERLVAERRRLPEYEQRRVTMTARLRRDEAIFVIRDEGPGFDVATLPDPLDPENMLKASGRGLLLIRAFVDEVQHNKSGNEITLIKRRTRSAGASSSGPMPRAREEDYAAALG